MILTLHDPRTARSYYDAGHWQDDTLYALVRRHADERPEAFALRDSRRRLTWKAVRRWTDAVAADLSRAGVRRGNRVSVWLQNCAEAVIILLACSRNGYVCNPSLHQNYTANEVLKLLERTRSAALFAQPGYGVDGHTSDIFEAAKALSWIKRVYELFPVSGKAGVGHTAPFPPDDIDPDPAWLPGVDSNADKIVYLAFTSGTTGQPKGVLHSDNTLLANGRSMVRDWGHHPGTVLYSHSPLSHHIATVAIEQALIAGCELVVNDLSPGVRPLDRIIETGATYVMGVPTHAIDILAEMKQRRLKTLGHVQIFYMAGSVIPPETAQALLQLGIKPQNIYGMTENGSHQYTLPDDDISVITSTCGKACHGYETRLWNPEDPDREAAPGEIGEIGTRGALLMLGYFDDQAVTESSFNSSGWFMSGDLGQFDAHGNLQIVGRKKDLVIRGGHNIHPSRIENLALAHPLVLKAAAFAVPDARLGERVCLAIIPRDGTPVDGQDLLQHLHVAGLSKYDMPEYFISLQSFPMTASGKILKRQLVDWVRAGQIHPVPVRWASTAKEANS